MRRVDLNMAKEWKYNEQLGWVGCGSGNLVKCSLSNVHYPML